ncbi:hypothetical protein EVAR_86379_1 [Eumeta japonica]|uniref:Uncharacterized protein n=1 Tax=Eumeta variegata TaxID=151549 RepID=A0A4C1WAC2_EUMVA|nr:hypothetical protein EVAR_86379_1 [Eumeta japonica]
MQRPEHSGAAAAAGRLLSENTAVGRYRMAAAVRINVSIRGPFPEFYFNEIVSDTISVGVRIGAVSLIYVSGTRLISKNPKNIPPFHGNSNFAPTIQQHDTHTPSDSRQLTERSGCSLDGRTAGMRGRGRSAKQKGGEESTPAHAGYPENDHATIKHQPGRGCDKILKMVAFMHRSGRFEIVVPTASRVFFFNNAELSMATYLNTRPAGAV